MGKPDQKDAVLIHSFAEKLKQGQAAEVLLDRYFSDYFLIAPPPKDAVGDWAESRGIDRIFEHRNTHVRLSVQYKTDWKAAETGNAFIETVSVDTSEVPGWAYTCLAQRIYYFVPPRNEIYELDTMKLKRHLPAWEQLYSTGKSHNATYTTSGLKVPLYVVGGIAAEIFTTQHLLNN